jgi:tetratricopeptide (TPR) repeat protein
MAEKYMENDDEFFSAESDTEDAKDAVERLTLDGGGRETENDNGQLGSHQNEEASGVGQSEEVDNTEDNTKEEEELTEEEIEIRKQQTEEVKLQGNEAFKNEDYEAAAAAYTKAIQMCPRACERELGAVCYGNRAACYVKLNRNEEAADDCTRALDLHASYLKVRIRRAQVYESLEKFEEALKDYEEILKQDPSCSLARAACMRLPQQIEEQREKLKEEMMGKLKELGNMVLKPFGLSTDNFQLQKDPNSGSYSINFKK